MDDVWWSLPGPTRFFERIARDVGEGRNVVVRLADNLPDARKALEGHLRRSDHLRVRRFDATEIAGSPSAALFTSLRCPRGADELETPQTLAANLPQGDVVIVHGIEQPAWPFWRVFIDEYQHACNGRPENRRAVFCLLTRGPLDTEPRDDATLVIREFTHDFSLLDGMLLFDQLLPEDPGRQFLRRLTVSIAAELAGTDALTTRNILDEGLNVVRDPLAPVRKAARRDRWNGVQLDSRPRCCGWWEQFDHRCRPTSAALVARGDADAVVRRIWHGQIRVLYPFIEEQRLNLLPEVENYLPLPVKTTFGVVERAIDLELGPMTYVLRHTRLPQRVWDRLVTLKDLRHDLAHMKPVAGDVLKSPVFTSICNTPS